MGEILALLAACCHCLYALSIKTVFHNRDVSPAEFLFWTFALIGGLSALALPFCDGNTEGHIGGLVLAAAMLMLGTKIFLHCIVSSIRV